jgi:hypothetical protein
VVTSDLSINAETRNGRCTAPPTTSIRGVLQHYPRKEKSEGKLTRKISAARIVFAIFDDILIFSLTIEERVHVSTRDMGETARSGIIKP